MSKRKELLSSDKCITTVLYDCPAHLKILLVGLNSLREKEELLDITLVVQKQVFHAHKAVLAACSDYFRAMFTDNMLESRQNEIVLNGISAGGFGVVLDYAYTSVLPLSPVNVQDVLSAASHLQMVEVVGACSNYLQSQIDVENCIDLATIAEMYSLTQLQEKVYKFMSSHLREFSMTVDFNRLSVQQLENLLTYDFPVDCSEADVLKTVLAWFNFDIYTRHKYAVRILRHIHFIEISPNTLEALVPRNFKSHDQKGHNSYLYKLALAESVRQRSSILKSPKNTHLLNSRGMEMALLKIGGFGNSGITNEITYCLNNSQKWRHLTTVPHVEQCNFGSVVFNNELYIVGGCFNQSLQENIHPFGFKYSPCFNKWNTLNPMRMERCRFSLNALGGMLYAVGGAIEIHDVFDLGLGAASTTDTCEVYDPKSDTWENIEPLPEVRMQHAGATYEKSTSKYLFISGGMEHDTVVSTLFRYDLHQNTWIKCQPMLSPRADHVMLTIDDSLYVCGGWKDDNDTRMRTHNCTIDKYDIASDSWETVTQIPTPRFHAGIVSVGKKIYVIGGFQCDAMFDKGSAAIECYCVRRGEWSALDKYPQDIWEHSCATLYIPKCRKDMEVLGNGESIA